MPGPFKTFDGPACAREIAAYKGVTLDPEVAAALDAHQEAANVASEALEARFRSGALDAEALHEARRTQHEAWIARTCEILGRETAQALFDADVVPGEPVPDLPEWPYWMRRTIAKGRSEERDGHGVELIQAIRFLAARGAYDRLDAVMARLDVSAVSGFALIALLRTPFLLREHLAQWIPFRERVRAEMNARGKDGDKVLVGLGSP